MCYSFMDAANRADFKRDDILVSNTAAGSLLLKNAA